MKTIVVETKKVTSHKGDGMAVIESITQKISPELTFNKFVKYLTAQNYTSVKVVKVHENGKELNEIEKYQDKINKVLKPDTKFGESIDYKSLSEKQASKLELLEQRLAALEDAQNQNKKTEDREALESKADELNISYRSNIGDEKLLAKIKEIEPEFNI